MGKLRKHLAGNNDDFRSWITQKVELKGESENG